jgi:hypothetical protein
MSQLLALPGDGDQYEYIATSHPSLLSFLFSDPHSHVDTPAVPPAIGHADSPSPFSKTSKDLACKREYALSSDLPFDSSSPDSSSGEEYDDSTSDTASTEPTTPRHVRHTLSSQEDTDCSGSGVVDELHGQLVLRYPDGSYRCLSIVTTNGKVSQYTQKSKLPPDVGQPCGQTFRGRDEIARHLKTTRWHKQLDEHETHTCGVCGRQLSRRDALTRHMRRLHLSALLTLHWLINKALTSVSRATEEGPQGYGRPEEAKKFEQQNRQEDSQEDSSFMTNGLFNLATMVCL